MAADPIQHRLDESQALGLFSLDLHELGRRADAFRRRLHGNRAYYVVNRHIHYTNLCALKCKICTFGHAPGQAGVYERSVEQIAQDASAAADGGASQIHLTGGLHPSWRIERYEQMLRAIRQAAPGLHIKAFTACEIQHIAALSTLTIEAVLERLIEAGLGSLPGGGAEILDDSIRRELFPGKISSQEWLDVHRMAHLRGLPTNATMLYGHGERSEHRIRHLMLLRQLQDETGGFEAFVPLAFISPPDGRFPPGPWGVDDLRVIAASRLVLDNFPHIKAFWAMQSLAVSSVALHFGADDIHAAIASYDIVARPGQPSQALSQPQLVAAIRAAGFEPCRCDGTYSTPRAATAHK